MARRHHMLAAAAVATALAACPGKSTPGPATPELEQPQPEEATGPSCDAAAENLVLVLQGDYEIKHDDTAAEAHALIVASCTDEPWPQEVVTCVAEEGPDEIEGCERLFDVEMFERFEDQLDALLAEGD